MHKSQRGKAKEAHWTAHGLNYWMALPRRKWPGKALARTAMAAWDEGMLLQKGFKRVLGAIPQV